VPRHLHVYSVVTEPRAVAIRLREPPRNRTEFCGLRVRCFAIKAWSPFVVPLVGFEPTIQRLKGACDCRFTTEASPSARASTFSLHVRQSSVRRPGIEPDCRSRPFTAAMAHQRACDAQAPNAKRPPWVFPGWPSVGSSFLSLGYPVSHPFRFSVPRFRVRYIGTVLDAKLCSWDVAHTTALAKRPLRDIGASDQSFIVVRR
jgi:hypothetical protein